MINGRGYGKNGTPQISNVLILLVELGIAEMEYSMIYH